MLVKTTLEFECSVAWFKDALTWPEFGVELLSETRAQSDLIG